MRNTHRAILGFATLAAVVLGAGILTARQAPANPAHAHIGHVMTSWKDTPEMKGFLPAAIADAAGCARAGGARRSGRPHQ